MSQQGKQPGSWATVRGGSFAGYTGRVVDFLLEEQDGIPVQGGLKYFVLQMEGVDSKRAFRRDEINMRR